MANSIHQFQNGLKLAHHRIPGVRSVAIGVFTGVGSANESKNDNGISHFIEHMVFKGTQKRSAFDIVCEIDGLGANINAFTSKQMTCYYTLSVDEYAQQCMDVLSDFYFHAQFDPEELEKEKGVVNEEIAMTEDDPSDLCMEKLSSAYFDGNSLGLTILGKKKTIGSFTPQRLRAYMREHYCADNTVVSIVGNITFEKALKLADRYFNREFGDNRSGNWHDRPHETASRSVVTKKNIEQANIGMAFPSLAFNDEKEMALMLVNTIFGGGMSSRLFQNIREKQGLAYAVYSYPSNYIHNGEMSIYLGTNLQSACKAIQSVREEVKRLVRDGLTKEEFERGKKQIKGTYILGQDNVSSLVRLYAKNALFADQTFDFDRKIAAIDAITMDDTREVIAKVFDLDKVSTSYVGKKIECDALEIMRS